MARKQTELAGFERQFENEACQQACEKWNDVVHERAALSRKEADAKAEAQATLRAHGYSRYMFWDQHAEAYRPAVIESKDTIVLGKELEHDDPPGEAVDTGDADADASGGLLEDAAKLQAANGVAESDDGDVVVPDVAAPKKKRGKGKKTS